MRKYQYYNTGDDSDRDIYGVNWGGQTFTPEITHLIGKLKLKLFRVGDPKTITISIKNTAAGKPVGADLCFGKIEGLDITLDSNGEWYEITLGGGAELTKDTQYAIVARAPNGDVSNKLSWRTDTSSPTYTGGTYCGSSDSGVDWSTYSGTDVMFEEWGAGEPSPTAIVWGNLPKSQISLEKIEEAIIRLIQNHEDDENAHVEVGESLYSHKASEIIDHAVNSIVANIIKDLEITPAKMSDALVFTHSWNSLDGWSHVDVGGRGVATAQGAAVYLASGDQSGDWSSIRTLARLIHSVIIGKVITIEFSIVYVWTSALTSCEVYLALSAASAQPFAASSRHYGFKILNASIYASAGDGANQTTVDTGIDIVTEAQLTRLKIEILPTEQAKYYINDVLKATITTNLPTYEVGHYLHFQIKTTTAQHKLIRFGRTLVERHK